MLYDAVKVLLKHDPRNLTITDTETFTQTQTTNKKFLNHLEFAYKTETE